MGKSRVAGLRNEGRERVKGGRPSAYRAELCSLVLDLGREGLGKTEIARKLDITRGTIDNWTKAHPEFADAMTRARDLSLAWWETQGKKGIWGGKDFNANAYNLQVRNRFPNDWQERSSVAISNKESEVFKTETKVTNFDELRAIIFRKSGENDQSK
jgi:hypothetical protein